MALILQHGVCWVEGTFKVNFWSSWFGQSKNWCAVAEGYLISITKTVDQLGPKDAAKVGVPFVKFGHEFLCC